MHAAQGLFDQMIGALCTKNLIVTLRKFLRKKGWRAKCLKEGCGRPLSMSWAKRYKTTPRLVCTHSDSNTKPTHASWHESLPQVTIYKPAAIAPQAPLTTTTAKPRYRVVVKRDSAQTSSRLPDPQISVKAAGVLARLDRIKAKAPKDREKAQGLFDELIDEPCTQELTKRLGGFLRKKKWGALCFKEGCHQASALVWHKHSQVINGGSLRCDHPGPPGQRFVSHGSFTRMPKLVLALREKRKRRAPSPALKGAAAAVLAKLAAIGEQGTEALERAQPLVYQLEGEPVTKALITRLRNILRRLKLAVKCLQAGCEGPAGLYWAKSTKNIEGGFMRCNHYRKEGNNHYVSKVILPRFELVAG